MVRRTILVGLLLIPGLAAGDDLELSIGASVEYDNNVFRSSRVEEDDVVFRVLPTASLNSDEGDLRYKLSYQLPFEQGIQYGQEISDFDQILTLQSTWVYDQANQFFLRNQFRFDRSVTRRFPTEDATADVSNQRDRVLTNNATVGMSHAFSPRTTGGLSFSHHYFDTEQRNRQGNQTYSLTGDLNYAVSARNQVGTGVSFTAQDFEAAGGIPESQTYYYNLFASWVHRFDETASFSISAGPTLIQLEEQDQAGAINVPRTPFVSGGGLLAVYDFTTCPGMTLTGCDLVLVPPGQSIDVSSTAVQFAGGQAPPGQSDLRLTVFGVARLEKRWTPDISTSLSYRRQQSGASGLGGSTIIDAVSAQGDWRIDRWWDFSLRGDFAHRESVSDTTQTQLVVQNGGPQAGIPNVAVVVPAPGTGLVSTVFRRAIETNNLGASGRLARQIGRRAEASLRLSYNRQLSDTGTRGRGSDYDVFLAIFGVRYRFEPITVW